MADRTINIGGVWAEGAPDVPGGGVPPTPLVTYRKSNLTLSEIQEAWPYSKIVPSNISNEILYRLSALMVLLEQTGTLPWSATTAYVKGAGAQGSDGYMYEALQASTNQNPISSPTYWTKVPVKSNLGIREPVRVVATAEIVLSGVQTIDSVLLAAGDFVLAAGQTTNPEENGVYEVKAGAPWVRRTDMDSSEKFTHLMLVPISEGTLFGGTIWWMTSATPLVMDTDPVAFAKFSGGLDPATTTTPGIVELATNTEAQTGTDATRALTPANLAATMLGGVGQVWTNVTASRAVTTTYTNTTGRPIVVSAWITSGSSANDVAVGNGYVGGVSITRQRAITPVANSVAIAIIFIVPNGATYKIDDMTSGSITAWMELR